MSVDNNVPGIRFKGFNGEWLEKELSEAIEIIGTGKSIFVANAARSDLSKFAILGSRGVIGYDCTYDYSGNFILTARVGENAGRLYKHSGDVKITDNTVFIKSDNLDFVFYVLTNFDLRRLAFGTGQPLIKASELNDLKLFFPFDGVEKTAIGNYFQKLDNLINQHQQKHDKFSNVKKAMLEKMFPKQGETVPEIRFKEFDGEWEGKELGEIGSLKNGMNFDKAAMGHGHPFVNLQDVFGKNEVSNKNLGLAFSTENQRKDYSLNEGDVLFIRSSVKPEGVGEAAVVPKNMENTTYSGFIIRFRPSVEMDVNFNRFVYSTVKSRKQILASSTSSANSNINQDSLQRIQLALPCKKEQTQIGNYFQKLDTLINQHQQQITKLNNIKQACLSKMFV